ncbi:hypothetical protein EHF33_00200 [Deinococcus psychrotolerans]|uniref:Uncharacterized protein n=1 Tax=Deinococcus psychrotolerans TaxID=2489213 RepID=A0A3G8YFQ7_9DEIO|nr:hypothetical protein [Deinococcus psychrotolerans]AZI41364.1 hypothetical protein EHF33_00200 [Deinococcus psychrotolerans]
MNWNILLVGLPLVLGALVLLIPLYFLVKFPRRLDWKAALGFIFAGVGTTFVLTLVLALVFSALTSIFPGLNPYRPPAFESIDGGLFVLLVSLDFALLFVCTAQWLLIWTRKLSTRSTK